MNSKPAHEIKNGNFKATIWRNAGKVGKPDFHSVQATRSFKVGDQWRESTSFLKSELPKLIEVLTQAKDWIASAESTSQPVAV